MAVLDKRLILLSADVLDVEACIALGGKLLMDNGYVKEGYVEALQKREKAFPTGLQGKSMAIAIPHTESTYVKKPAVAVMILKHPVRFKAMGTTDQYLDCELVFVLVVKDPAMQVTMLRKMMEVIQNAELLKRIKNAQTKEDVMSYLSQLNDRC